MLNLFNRFMNFLRAYYESDLQFLTVHHPLTTKEPIMSLQDTIAADQTALAAAHDAQAVAAHTVDMAQSQLDADVARLAVIQPQLDNFDAMETAYMANVDVLVNADGTTTNDPLPREVEFLALIAKGRALVGG